MAIWGADIAQLKNLGTKLQAGSTEIEKQKSLLTKVLEGTDWKGPDADKFRSEWHGQHAAALAKVAQALDEAGKQANAQRFPAGGSLPLSGNAPEGRTQHASGPPAFQAVRHPRLAPALKTYGTGSTSFAWSSGPAPPLVPGFGGPELVQPDQHHPADDQQAAQELDGSGQFAKQQPRPDDGEQHLGERDKGGHLGAECPGGHDPGDVGQRRWPGPQGRPAPPTTGWSRVRVVVSAVLMAIGSSPVAAVSHMTAAPTRSPPEARTMGGRVSFSLAVMKK